MEIKKHIGFRTTDEPELMRYLIDNELPWNKGELVSTLDICESNPHWHWIFNYVKNRKMFVTTETVFTKNELQTAEWLCVRSKWRYGYPQPESNFGYESITYSKENHCSFCGNGLEQIDSFRMKKAPKWGRKNFLMLNWIDDELFLNDKVKTDFEAAGITRIGYKCVKNSSGNAIIPTIYQLEVPHLQHTGIADIQDAIDQTDICPHCGSKKYHLSGIGMLKYKKEVFKNAPDIVKTQEIFGWGFAASRNILVSQKVYQLISTHGLDRELLFEPIELV